MTSLPERELERRIRVVDQLLSAHSTLRDRYSRRALLLDVIGLALATILCLLTLADLGSLTRLLRIDSDVGRLVLAAVSGAVFLASLVQLRTDWKAVAAEHGRAVERLARIKTQYRRFRFASLERSAEAGGTESTLLEEADRVLRDVRPIPDREFVALKAKHLRKVYLSQLASRFPGASVRIAGWRLWWRQTRRALRSLREEDGTTTEDG